MKRPRGPRSKYVYIWLPAAASVVGIAALVYLTLEGH